jgi:hypothetical protein
VKIKLTVTLLACLTLFSEVKAQHLVSATPIDSLTGFIIGLGISQECGCNDGNHNDVAIYKILYKTTNVFNAPTIASGALLIPRGIACTSLPLLSFDHGTVLARDEAPSEFYDDDAEGIYFASKGYVVTMPDYLGLGSDTGIQPYLHSVTEARATIDLMRAAREFFSKATASLNGQVFITGYSQGGHAAMATLKYIADSSLANEFSVTAGAPMSGPYALSRVEAKILDTTYADNEFIPMIVNSYQYAYTNLYSSIGNFYKSPYDTLIPKYLTGDSSTTQLNAILPSNTRGFMQDSIIDKFEADSISLADPLHHDLQLNDNYSWVSTAPLKLCYCGGDSVVLPGNSIMAFDSMTARGSAHLSLIDINPALNHGPCEIPALTYVRTWFDSLKATCTASAVPQVNNVVNTMLVYPNPAAEVLNVYTGKRVNDLVITDLRGSIIYSKTDINSNVIVIHVTGFENGLYIIKATDYDGNSSISKMTVAK